MADLGGDKADARIAPRLGGIGADWKTIWSFAVSNTGVLNV